MSLRSNYPDQFLATELPALDMLIFEEYERVPDHLGEIFRMEGIDGWGDQDLQMAGLKTPGQKDEGAAYEFDDPIEGYSKTYLPVEYALATSFSEILLEDNKRNLVEDTYRSLGTGMYQVRQVAGFNIFNNGFADSGPDSANLFSTSHTMIGGHTYANKPSTDIVLSKAGLQEMDVDMMRQVNHRNIQISVIPEVLIVPPELKQDALTLMGSPDDPSTANRAKNIYYGNYKVIISPFLTSTTAWFVISNKVTHKLKFRDRVMPSTKTWIDDKTGDVCTRMRCRFDVGYSDFIGTWGTDGV